MCRPIRQLLASLAIATAALLTACSSGGSSGNAERFCSEVKANTQAMVKPRIRTAEDVDNLLVLYRDLGELAPLAIEAEWDALILNYETASTVEPTDPESVQRVAARAYATEQSAVAVQEWLLTNCAVDIGPVATLVRHDQPARRVPVTTLPAET